MPKNNSPGKPRKKLCPECYTLSYNRCNYCTNKECNYNFYRFKKSKKNLIKEFNMSLIKSKFTKLINYDKDTITDKIYNDNSFKWLK